MTISNGVDTNKLSTVEQILAKVSQIEPPENLLTEVNLAIKKIELRRAKIRIWLFSSLLTVAFIGMVITAQMVWKEFIQSGTWQLFDMIFSDFVQISLIWKEYVLSLSQAIPFVSIILTLGFITLFLTILRKVTKQINIYTQAIGFKHDLSI